VTFGFPRKAVYKPSPFSSFISSFTLHSHSLKLSLDLSVFLISGDFSLFRSFYFFNTGDARAFGFESDNDNPSGAPPIRYATKVTVAGEHRLRINYDIRSSVDLHFQDLATWTINGGEVAIFERMLMAGLRFSFPAIAWELVVFLGVAPTQIVPNMWRYLFGAFILWQMVLGTRMTILEFFNIYWPAGKSDGTVEFSVRVKPIFIYLCLNYSNNKHWRQQVF
jgi:hypothetical protein